MMKLVDLKNTDIQLIDGDRGKNYPSKTELLDDGFCIFLDSSNVTSNGFDFSNLKYITKEKDGLLRNGKLIRNDIVITTRGSVGHIALYDDSVPFENIRINSGMLIVRCHDDYDALTLYYLLKSNFIYNQINNIMSGSVQKQLPVSAVQMLKIPVSNDILKESFQLAHCINKKIQINNKLCTELESMAKTLYDYWFLQFDFPDENGKPYKTSGGEMVYNEQLKRYIPKGWKVGILSDIANITMGQSPRGDSYNENGKGMIFYQGCTDFGFRFPIPRMYTSSPSRLAKKGDILLSVRAPVGTLNFAMEDCCVGRGLSALNSKIGSQLHLYYTLMGFQSIFNVLDGNGTTFGSITKDTLFEMPVVIPNNAILKKFESIVSPIENRIESCEVENRELINLRDWLLPMLMNGQAIVK